MMLIPFALSSLIGATLYNAVYTDYSYYICLLAVMFLIGLLFLQRWLKKQITLMLLIAWFGSVTGFAWFHYHMLQSVNSWRLPSQAILHPILVTGIIVESIQLESQLFRYELLLKQGSKVRLYARAKQALLPGTIIKALVKLKPPWGNANPGSRSHEKSLFIKNIRATGTLIQVDSYQQTQQNRLARWRFQLYQKINALLDEHQFKGILLALAIGWNQQITPQQWEVFQKTGIAHVIAISGLHISLVASIYAFIITFVVRRFYMLTIWMPAQYYGTIFGFMVAFLYSAIAGFSIPTQRALIMAGVLVVALMKRQPLFSWTTLAMAWMFIEISFPLAILQTGFWLSFGCVTVLIYAQEHLKYRDWRKWFMPHIIVFIGLIPLCAFFFQQIPLLSIFANTITLPIMTLLIVPCSLMGLISLLFSDQLALLFFSIGNITMKGLWWVLTKMADLPFCVVQTQYLTTFKLILSLLGVLWLLQPQKHNLRHLGWLTFVPLFMGRTHTIHYGEFQFTLFDVGQGLSAIIHTQHHHLLFDTGPRFGQQSAGSQIIMPYLKFYGISKLDKVIISHNDLDHRGGLEDLHIPIKDLVSSGKIDHARLCLTGEKWHWEGVDFEFLNGPNTHYSNKNNASCVLKISNGFQSVLLTGDIEQAAEKALVLNYSSDLKSTVLVVPHHGSKTSSSWDFIQAVRPQYVLFAVGFLNRFGFPKPEIMERYRRLNSRLYRTDETGALIFHLKQTQELTPPIRWRDTDYHYGNQFYGSGEKDD